MKLTPFEALFLTHFIADWLFQTHWEAMKKTKYFLPLFVHSSIYTLAFIPAFYFYSFKWPYLLLLFVSHLLLDNRKFVIWWIENIKRTKMKNLNEPIRTVLLITIDQIFHLLVLGFLVVVN